LLWEIAMAIQVQYDVVFSEGGSPRSQSFRGSRRGAVNSGAINVRLLAPADSSDWQTPCGQNRLDGYVTISGEASFYGVVVNVSGAVTERGQLRGTGTATGGLSWAYNDDKETIFANGHLNATAVPPPPTVKTSPVAGAYSMIIPVNQRTKVCSCSIAGGLRLAPRNTAFIASVEVTASLMYVLQFANAFLNFSEAFRTVRVPFTIPPDVRVVRGPTEFIDLEAFFSRTSSNVRIDEDFQDPGLRAAIGAATAAEATLPDLVADLLAESDTVQSVLVETGGLTDAVPEVTTGPASTSRRRRERGAGRREGGGR
jgi:hypothetical protein